MTRMTVAEAKRLGLLSLGKKKGKYGNSKTVYNGRKYDSKKEAHRALELDLLVKAKVVRSWQPQARFMFTYNGVRICSYFADFAVQYADGSTEYEDVKGVRTAVFIIKKKLVKAFYGIDIKEI